MESFVSSSSLFDGLPAIENNIYFIQNSQDTLTVLPNPSISMLGRRLFRFQSADTTKLYTIWKNELNMQLWNQALKT